LAHSASFESFDKNAPSKAGTKHLPSYNEEIKERLDNATQDYNNDGRGLREFLRDIKKEYAEYWVSAQPCSLTPWSKKNALSLDFSGVSARRDGVGRQTHMDER
jgi:hypothetical protein